MALTYQAPLEVRTHTGGFTDSPSTGRPDQCSVNDNLQPEEDSTIRTRDGSAVYDNAVRRFTPGSGNPVKSLLRFKETVFAGSAGNFRYSNGSTLITARPTVNAASNMFTNTTATNRYSYTKSDKKLVIADTDGGGYMMILTHEDDIWASNVASQFLPGDVDYVTNDTITFALHGYQDNDRIRFTTSGTLPSPLVTDREYFVTAATTNTFKVSLTYDGSAIDLADAGTGIHNVFRMKSRVRTLGLPNIPLTASDQADITFAAGAGGIGGGYLYYIMFAYDYKANGKTYRVTGNTGILEVDGNDVSASAAKTHTLTNLPWVGATYIPVLNYDRANIKLEIYRTIKGGVVAYKVGEVHNADLVANPTLTFSDTMSDDTAQNQTILYREGGVVNHNEAPLARYVTSTKNAVYACNVITTLKRTKTTVSLETNPNRVIQTVTGDQDNFINSFFVDLDQPITGCGNTQGFPIVFTEDRTYRVEGQFTQFGTGAMIAREVSGTVGCLNHDSVVNTPRGVYFAARDGFFFTDGYRMIRISSEWEETYRLITESDYKIPKIYGAYDFRKRLVYWAVSDEQPVDPADAESNAIYVFDEDRGVKEDGAFYRWANGRHFQPSALLYDSTNILRGDVRGWLFKHDESYRTDPYLNPSGALVNKPDGVTPSETAIVFEYISSFYDFGVTYLRKWASTIKVFLENITAVNVQIGSGNDGVQVFKDMEPITFKDNFAWGDESVVWGDPDLTWDFKGNVYGSRHFPRNHSRCDTKQVRMTNAEVIIYEHNALDTVTLVGNSVNRGGSNPLLGWTSDLMGYYIELSSDGGVTFEEQREITSLAANDLTYDGAPFASGTYTYRISGIKKDQRMRLISYSIKYAYISNQGSFKRAEQ